MRVISGKLGGQTFEAPRGHRTHPMSEKMRGAIFSALGDIKGLTVLDCFSGSGALAIEAISRGAKCAVCIESDKRAFGVIQINISKLSLDDQIKATRAYINAWSKRSQSKQFDLVFCDPPYDDLPYRDLKRVPAHLKAGGTLVLSWPAKMKPLSYEGLGIVQNKDYGDSQLVFYQKID